MAEVPSSPTPPQADQPAERHDIDSSGDPDAFLDELIAASDEPVIDLTPVGEAQRAAEDIDTEAAGLLGNTAIPAIVGAPQRERPSATRKALHPKAIRNISTTSTTAQPKPEHPQAEKSVSTRDLRSGWVETVPDDKPTEPAGPTSPSDTQGDSAQPRGPFPEQTPVEPAQTEPQPAKKPKLFHRITSRLKESFRKPEIRKRALRTAAIGTCALIASIVPSGSANNSSGEAESIKSSAPPVAFEAASTTKKIDTSSILKKMETEQARLYREAFERMGAYFDSHPGATEEDFLKAAEYAWLTELADAEAVYNK